MIPRPELLHGPFRKVVREGRAEDVFGRLKGYADAILECGHVAFARPKRCAGGFEHPKRVRCKDCRDGVPARPRKKT